MSGRTLLTCDDCEAVRFVHVAEVAVLPAGGEGERDRVRVVCPSCGYLNRRDVPMSLGVVLVMAGAHVQLGDEIAPPDVAAFEHDLEITSFLAPLAGAT